MTRRRMTRTQAARVGGLSKMVRHGADAYADMGRKGQATLDARIAAEAGIPPDLPPEDYGRRLAAARRLYYIRLAEARWVHRLGAEEAPE